MEAPVVFVTAILVLVAAIWAIFQWQYKDRISNLRTSSEAWRSEAEALRFERERIAEALEANAEQDDLVVVVDEMRSKVESLDIEISEIRKVLPSDQPILRGSNSSGRFERAEDGSQTCRSDIQDKPTGKDAHTHVIFPAVFSGVPRVTVLPEGWADAEEITNTGFKFRLISSPQARTQFRYEATGCWRPDADSTSF